MNILDQFDTVSASEKGAWLHLCAPGTDKPVYSDVAKKKPLRIKLKGPDSDEWTSFQRTALTKGKKSDDQDEKTQADIAAEDARLFARMTVAWENMPAEVGEFTQENATSLYVKYKDIRMQALRFVMNQANFTKKPPEA